MMKEETMIGGSLPIAGQMTGGNRHDVLRLFENAVTNFFKIDPGPDGKKLFIVLSRCPRGEEEVGQLKRELSMLFSGVQDGFFDTVEAVKFRGSRSIPASDLPMEIPSMDHLVVILGGLPSLKTFAMRDFFISARALAAFFESASMLQCFGCGSPVNGTVEDFNLWADAISSGDGSSLRAVKFTEEGSFRGGLDNKKCVKWEAVIQALARRSLKVSSSNGENGLEDISIYSGGNRIVLSNETSHLISRLELNGCLVSGTFDLSFDTVDHLVVHCRKYAERFIEHYRPTPENPNRQPLQGVYFHFTSELPDTFISKLLKKNRFGSADVNVRVASQYHRLEGGVKKDVTIYVSRALIAPGKILSRLQDEYPHDRGLVTPLFDRKENNYLCVALNKWNLFDFDPANETTENEAWVRMLSVLANIPKSTRLVPGGDPFMQECSLSPLFDLLVQNAYIIGKLTEAGVQT